MFSIYDEKEKIRHCSVIFRENILSLYKNNQLVMKKNKIYIWKMIKESFIYIYICIKICHKYIFILISILFFKIKIYIHIIYNNNINFDEN